MLRRGVNSVLILRTRPLSFAGSVILLALASLASAQTAKLKVRGALQYVHGTNLAWLDGRYGNDFGLNPLHPEWGNSYSSANVNTYFNDMKKMNLNVVRVWLCESLQGFTFDSNGNATGLSATFLANVDDLMAKANTHKMSVYFTFFNGNDMKDQFGKVLPSGATIKNFVNDATARTAVLNNVIGTLATRYKTNTAVFGYDLINESNIGADNGGYTWANMRTFGQQAATKIHTVAPGTQVTMSTQWLQAFDPANFAGSYGGLGFDMYDMHEYTDSPNLQNTNTMGADKPVLLGEYGPNTTSDSVQQSTTATFTSQAGTRNWAGTLQWDYAYPGSTDGYRLVNAGGVWRPVCTTLYTYGANLATFTGTATSASSVNRGSVLAITGTYNCTAGRLSNAVVDMEVYNSANQQVAQTWWTTDFYRGDAPQFTWNWTVPSNLPPGTYHVAVAVFGQNWTPLRLWNGSAKTFTVN